MSINYKELKDTLLTRRSIRTYGNVYPTEQQVSEIRSFIEILNQMTEPFHQKCRFVLQTEDFYGIKTFGFITGCKYWIYGVIPRNNPDALKQYGFLFELLLLKCTQMNLGTVWLGGTFTTSSFTAIEYDSSKEYIPCVSPVGVDGKGMELLSKIMGARKRKEWKTMFFDETFEKSLTKENVKEPFTEFMFEAMRFAPSARNVQEWKIVVEGKNVHFFGEVVGNFHEVDLGICIANGYVAFISGELKGNLVKKDEMEIREKVKAPKELEYFISFVLE